MQTFYIHKQLYYTLYKR